MDRLCRVTGGRGPGFTIAKTKPSCTCEHLFLFISSLFLFHHHTYLSVCSFIADTKRKLSRDMAFSDFPLNFDPSLFPESPPVPPSSELFSTSETSNLFGFLEDFKIWELDPDTLSGLANTLPDQYLGNIQPEQVDVDVDMNGNVSVNTGLDGSLNVGGLMDLAMLGVDARTRAHHPYSSPRIQTQTEPRRYRSSSASSSSHTDSLAHTTPSSATSVSLSSSSTTANTITSKDSPADAAAMRNVPKPLLTDPQKRINHIMSEQKRRNAIRDGYAQLTTLLAPAGAPPGSGMPTRGRPKGSGGKSRPAGAGKSGVLLRAVEYCRWLEEGRDALRNEVLRVEAAAEIRVE